PEQNNTFTDHYIEVEYDLSEVMFVATANTLNIPPPLLDRMEVIRLSGYTEDEKMNIATRYLLPKQIKATGLKEAELSVSEAGIRDIVRYYTREAGVRALEREISKICRKAVKQLLTEKAKADEAEAKEAKAHRITVTPKNLDKFLGVRRYTFGMAENEIHIHLPEGATPKDGPSAGIGMTTAIVSMLTGIPVRADVAMTGEITLRGEVLQIGGLKEKLLAAHRGAIKTVMIPEENVKDLVEIPDNIKNRLEIVPVKWIDKVLEIALERQPEPLSEADDS